MPNVRDWILSAWAALVLGVLALSLVDPPPGLEEAWQWVGGMMAFPVAAALILMRRPGNRVGLALGLVANASLVNFFLYWFALTYLDSPVSPAAETVSGAMVPVMFGGIIIVLYIFPTGSTLGRWHARMLILFAAYIALAVVLFALSPGSLGESGRANPWGVLPTWTRSAVDNGFVVLPFFAAVGVGSLVIRWRRAGVVERTQLRWLLTAAAFFAFVVLMIAISGDDDAPGSVGFVVASIVVLLGFWSIPAGIVVAVTRYRLYDIDRLISRTVSYAMVAGALGGVYAVVAVGLPQLLELPDDSPLLVAAATLAVAALFNPVRRRVQIRVDRRFNRARYDAQQEVEDFADRLRNDLDLDELVSETLQVITNTVEPTSAASWVREGRG